MAELVLPPKMDLLRKDLGDLVSHIDAKGVYGAILLSSRRGLRIEVDNSVESVIQDPPRDGSVVTAFDGETVHERSLCGFDAAATQKRVKELRSTISRSSAANVSLGPERKGVYATPMEIDPASLTTEQKLDRCRDLHRRTTELARDVINVRLSYIEGNEYSVFGSGKADLAQRVQRLVLYLVVIVGGPDGSRAYDMARRSGTCGWEGLEFTDDELESLVQSAHALLGAERVVPGEHTIITSPGVSGVLCHESFGHGVETDMFVKERARAARYLGKVVASPLVSIYDDPSLPGGFGSYYFDDEGWLASPTQIVEAGILRRGITDLYSATVLGLERTANGRRQDFTRKAYARMSNTFFGRGETPVSDLFAQVEDGVYLEKWSSGMEDPLGWGVQVTCHVGREIKNGKVTERVFSPVALTGYVPKVLRSISAVGDSFALEGGHCGKGHKETVRASDGGPHLLLRARLG